MRRSSVYCEACKRISLSIKTCYNCGMRVCGRCRSRGNFDPEQFGPCDAKEHYSSLTLRDAVVFGRETSQKTIDRVVRAYQERDPLVIPLPPEGARNYFKGTTE